MHVLTKIIHKEHILILWLVINALELESKDVGKADAQSESNEPIDFEKNTAKLPENPTSNAQISITDRISAIEMIVAEQNDRFQQFQKHAEDEIKVMRNATLLLLDVVSGRSGNCQGVLDVRSKIQILYDALAKYEPLLNNVATINEIDIIQEPKSTATEMITSTLTTTELISAKVNFEKFILTTSDPEIKTDNDVVNASFTQTTNAEDFSLASESSNEAIILNITEETETTTYSTTSNKPKLLESTTVKHYDVETPVVTETPSTTTVTPETTSKVVSKSTFKSTNRNIIRKSKKKGDCPEKSKLVGRECFSLHLEKKLNWAAAREFCREMGGDLAEPNLNNNRLPKQLLSAWPELHESSYWTLWVGATDQELEGKWHWVTGGILNLRESPRWEKGDPIDEAEAQDCLAMVLWIPGRWQSWSILDDSCELEWQFFCEYSML